MAGSRGRWLRLVSILVLAATLVAIFHPRILRAYGDLLVHADPPASADAILVLAGDFGGDRIRTAGKLLHEGYAPYALVSGPMMLYGQNEADLAIGYVRSQGYRDERFEPLYFKAASTIEEAAGVAPEIRRRGIKRLLIVTSDYHTARARRLFLREFRNEINIRTVAASDPHFERGRWWLQREGLKTVFYESLKTIESAVER